MLWRGLDYWVNCTTEYKAKESLQDEEVIRYFKEVDFLPQAETNSYQSNSRIYL
jgi:hypothetical protein